MLLCVLVSGTVEQLLASRTHSVGRQCFLTLLRLLGSHACRKHLFEKLLELRIIGGL